MYRHVQNMYSVCTVYVQQALSLTKETSLLLLEINLMLTPHLIAYPKNLALNRILPEEKQASKLLKQKA